MDPLACFGIQLAKDAICSTFVLASHQITSCGAPNEDMLARRGDCRHCICVPGDQSALPQRPALVIQLHDVSIAGVQSRKQTLHEKLILEAAASITHKKYHNARSLFAATPYPSR